MSLAILADPDAWGVRLGNARGPLPSVVLPVRGERWQRLDGSVRQVQLANVYTVQYREEYSRNGRRSRYGVVLLGEWRAWAAGAVRL